MKAGYQDCFYVELWSEETFSDTHHTTKTVDTLAQAKQIKSQWEKDGRHYAKIVVGERKTDRAQLENEIEDCDNRIAQLQEEISDLKMKRHALVLKLQ